MHIKYCFYFTISKTIPMKQSTLLKVCLVMIVLAWVYISQGQNQQRIPREKMKSLLPVVMISESDPDYQCQVNAQYSLEMHQFQPSFKTMLLQAPVFGEKVDKLEVTLNEKVTINAYRDPRFSLEDLQKSSRVDLFYKIKKESSGKKYMMLYCKPKDAS